MSDDTGDETVIEAPTSYKRDHAGRFAKGGSGGPGRMPREALRRYVEAVRPLLPSRERMGTGLQVLQAAAPDVAERCARIAVKSRDEATALKAAELVLAYTLGRPVERQLIGTANLNATSTPAEKHERLQRLLERVRTAVGNDAGMVIDAQPSDAEVGTNGGSD